MTADPRCLVCRGAGTIRDVAGRDETCACTEHPLRDPYVAPKPGWVGEALEDALRRAETLAREAEEHARVCTDRPCVRCEKFVCRTCGQPFDGGNPKQCPSCIELACAEQALAPMRDSVPKRFRWAFGSPVEALRGRVRASDELVRRALANPPAADMVLWGDTAAGKTSLAVAMLDAWVRQCPNERRGARFFEAYWLAGARGRFPLGQGEPPEVASAMGASLLVVDDLGSEVDDRRNVLADVIFRRHNDELPTWVTTGFTTEQLMGRYGSQVMRRILETGKRVHLGAKA